MCVCYCVYNYGYVCVCVTVCIIMVVCVRQADLNCNQWHVPGDGPALNCNQDMFRLQLRCSGGTSNFGVDTGLHGRLSSSLHANGFEGWCSPCCFGPCTASGRCCGDSDSSLVRGSGLRGAYRPSNAHEDGRPVALKTDLVCINGPAS